jgi:protein-S-isoprenylcysteine O-methyltransferase Ste14
MAHWAWLLPWPLFFAYWLIRALSAAKATERESLPSRLVHLSLLSGSLWLLLSSQPSWPPLDRPLWPSPIWLLAIGLAITVGGLGFAVWAREHLGRNWSGTVTFKEGHSLIRTGPYRLVRHPIYTGLLVAMIGAAIGRGQLRGLLALGVALLALARKITLEERLLTRHFGDEHRQFQREVKALIPYLW